MDLGAGSDGGRAPGAQQPGIGTPCEGTRTQGVRRLLVSRIRHFVYYRATADTLEVLAVWHTRRGKQPSV